MINQPFSLHLLVMQASPSRADSGALAQSRKDVAKMLDEVAESVSIRQKLQQLQQKEHGQSHEKERDQER